MQIRAGRAAVILLLLLGTIGGSTTSSRAQSSMATQPTMRVGYFANITHAQAVLGFGDGAFTKGLAGVTVRPTIFGAGPDELNAIFAGAIDIGYIGPGPAINGFVRSHGGVVIVAGAANGGSLLVARAGTGIKTVKDLAGKTVAIPQLGNTQDILLRSLLVTAGLKPSANGGSVRIIAVTNADTLTLFKKKNLDAALVPEPWGSQLVALTGATVVLDWQQIYGGTTPSTVIVASASFLKAHPDLVVRFLRVHDQLTTQLQQARGHTSAVTTALNAQIKVLTGAALSPSVLASALTRTTFTTAISQPTLTQFAAFSVESGYLKQGVSLTGLVATWPLAHLHDASIK
jgi:NitT/TauT family transport system substrate-binding protein